MYEPSTTVCCGIGFDVVISKFSGCASQIIVRPVTRTYGWAVMESARGLPVIPAVGLANGKEIMGSTRDQKINRGNRGRPIAC
jgi:hypothetical protein